MTPRFKLLAAALGLVMATGTIGEASARNLHRTIVKKTVITRSVVAPRLHRVVVVPRRPVLHRFVAYRGPVVVRTHIVRPRIARAPIVLKRQALAHRTIVRKTIIR